MILEMRVRPITYVSCLIYHSKVDKCCQKSHDHVFFQSGRGLCQKIMLNYKELDPQNRLCNCFLSLKISFESA